MSLIARNIIQLSLPTLLFFGIAPSALAEEEVMEEIIVTAQGRDQSTLDVPIAVTAMDGELLKDVGANSLKDVQYMIPGLQITEQNGNGSDRITLRGVSPPGNNQPTVGRYFEETPINSEITQFGITLPFFDIERVEVLRGPQGTLYGEGSVGGTVRTITRKPTIGEIDGELELSGVNVDDGDTGYSFKGAGNLPIDSDTFAVRIAGMYEDTPGYIDTPRFGDDVNSAETWAVRTNILWQPSDAVDIALMYQHLDSEADGNQYSLPGYSSNLYVLDPASFDEYDLANLVIDIDLGFADLTSSTGWLDRETFSSPDLSNVFVGPLNAGLGIPVDQINDIVGNLEQTNELLFQELRLSSATENGGFWQVGISYRETETVVENNVASVEGLPILGTAVLLGGPINQDIEAMAIYGDYSFPVSETLELTIGGRYFEDERDVFNPLVFFFQPLLVDEIVDNDAFTGRAAVTWRHTENHMAYLSVSEGFRSGGAQLIDVQVLPLTYDPEELMAYELGFKGNFNTDVLQYELVFFFIDYENVQTFEPNPLSLQAFGNGGEAEMTGYELSLVWQPIENLFISGTYGYNDNEYTEPGLTHEEGDPLDYVSEVTSSASVDYQWAIGNAGLRGHFRIDFQHADAYQYSLAPGAAVFNNDTLDIFNVRFGVQGNNWGAYLFADNVNDENGIVFPAAAQDREPVLQRPRTMGLTFRRSFD